MSFTYRIVNKVSLILDIGHQSFFNIGQWTCTQFVSFAYPYCIHDSIKLVWFWKMDIQIYICPVNFHIVHRYWALDIHVNVQCPNRCDKVDNHCTNLCECQASNIDVTRLTFTVQIYVNVQCSISMWQGWHSLYKSMWMSSVQYQTKFTVIIHTMVWDGFTHISLEIIIRFLQLKSSKRLWLQNVILWPAAILAICKFVHQVEVNFS